ncbi:MAG: flagellar basal-body rod protein FlgF [Deltaproteobacteria bacterium]|nr:MAG: flagellar basal-body rod protein FlgF [Deltaproteobacteria bacterium]
MSGGMYLAAAGALVQQMRLNTLANNVANIDTVGFKGEMTVFQDPEQGPASLPETDADRIQPLSPYAPPFHTVVDFGQGALKQTGNPLDVAINGDGFFTIQTPDGPQYTRQGSFTRDEDGTLITPDGYPVLGEGGEITLQAGIIDIDSQGTIYVNGDEIDRFQVVDFENRLGLQKVGNGRFAAPQDAQTTEPAEITSLNQGYLEQSNVNAVRAMTEMIETSRAFTAYQKVIQTADDATEKSINDVGKTA